jgi:hypothetical protein
MKLEESLKAYKDRSYTKVVRNEDAYLQAEEITASELERLVYLYKFEGKPMSRRLLRDSIDHWLRRYHGYAIQGDIGSHYAENGTTEKRIFEHVIPASKIRDLLLAGVLSSVQAMNAPTCLLSETNDRKLRNSGLVSSTTNYWLFFERYANLGIDLHTDDGYLINQDAWTLEKHFNYFGIK